MRKTWCDFGNAPVAQVLGAIGGSDQVLVFVHSRKETYKTGKFLKDTAMAAETLARFVKARSLRPRAAALHCSSTSETVCLASKKSKRVILLSCCCYRCFAA